MTARESQRKHHVQEINSLLNEILKIQQARVHWWGRLLYPKGLIREYMEQVSGHMDALGSAAVIEPEARP